MTPTKIATINKRTTPAATIATFGIPDDFVDAAPDATAGAGAEAAGLEPAEVAAKDCAAVLLLIGVTSEGTLEPTGGCELGGAAILALAPIGAPHFVQNFVSLVSVAPHFVQNRRSEADSAEVSHRAPHFVQNASRSVTTAPHSLQLIVIRVSVHPHSASLLPFKPDHFCPHASMSGSRMVLLVL